MAFESFLKDRQSRVVNTTTVPRHQHYLVIAEFLDETLVAFSLRASLRKPFMNSRRADWQIQNCPNSEREKNREQYGRDSRGKLDLLQVSDFEIRC